MVEVSTSILTMEKGKEAETLLALEKSKTDYFHIDVMDGNFVEKDIKDGTLIEIPLRKNISTRTVGFAYSKESVHNSAVTKFKQILKETYGK